jgi:hypothetical protein
MSKCFLTREKTRQAAANAVHEQEVLFKDPFTSGSISSISATFTL